MNPAGAIQPMSAPLPLDDQLCFSLGQGVQLRVTVPMLTLPG